jgi:hypothetical protein
VCVSDLTDGYDPRSPYVETFWLPTLGPTSIAIEPVGAPPKGPGRVPAGER